MFINDQNNFTQISIKISNNKKFFTYFLKVYNNLIKNLKILLIFIFKR